MIIINIVEFANKIIKRVRRRDICHPAMAARLQGGTPDHASYFLVPTCAHILIRLLLQLPSYFRLRAAIPCASNYQNKYETLCTYHGTHALHVKVKHRGRRQWAQNGEHGGLENQTPGRSYDRTVGISRPFWRRFVDSVLARNRHLDGGLTARIYE